MKKSLLLIIGLLVSLISFGQTTSELVFKFPLDGNPIDVSGNNRSGTIVGGVTPTTDRFGNANSALLFDGTTGFIDIPYSTGIGTSDFTVSFWGNVDAANTGMMFSKDRSNDGNSQFRVGFANTSFTFIETTSGPIGFTPLRGIWNNYTFTRTGTVLSLYVNGSLVSTYTNSDVTNFNNSYNYRIGARYLYGTGTTGCDYFKGKIDDVTMYNRALSATEIAANFTSSTPNKGLLAWYKFDNSSVDSSGNALNLTLVSGTKTGTTDRFGNTNSALQFGGLSNPTCYTINNSKLDFSTAFSFSCWFNLGSNYGMDGNQAATTNGSNQALFAKAGDNGGGGALLYNSSWGFMFPSDAAKGGAELVNDTSYRSTLLNKWTHVVLTLTKTTENIYVDGRLVYSKYSATGAFDPSYMNSRIMSIGRYPSSVWYPVNGSLDDIKFYNRELSATEISKLYSNNDLIAAYTANTGVIKDESPLAWQSTVGNGVTLGSDRFGTNTAMSFDGTSNANITISKSSAAFNTLPLGTSFWFNASNLTGYQSLLNKYISASYNGFSVMLINNILQVWYYKDASNAIMQGNCQIPITANTWYHVVANYSSTGAQLYLNGQLVSSASWTGTQGPTTSKSNIIFGSASTSNYTGKLDDIRIFNRTLTTDEINNYYTEGGGNLKAGLIAYFPFNGNSKDSVSGTACTVNGTVTSATNRFGKANAAYSFDGASNLSFASFGLKIPANAITISLWAKSATTTTGSSVFCLSNDKENTTQAYLNRLNAHIRWVDNTKTPATNTIYWDYGDYDNSTAAIKGRISLPNAPMTDNSWEHFVFVAGSTGMQIYRNGVLIQSGTNHSSFTAADVALLIGGKGGLDNPFYSGTLDDIKIYSRPLNATEVNSLFTEDGGNKFAGSIAYFPYDGNAKDTLSGATSTVSSGTITAVANRFGKANSAYQFTKNWYVTQLTQTNITEYSVSAWVKMNDGEVGQILNNRTDLLDANCRAMSLTVENDNTVFFGINGSDKLIGTFAPKKVNDGSWHHIVGVFKGTRGVAVTQANFSVYIDGVLMPYVSHSNDYLGMSAGQIPPFNGNGYTRIGNNVNLSSNVNNSCILDQVRIFDRAITLQEVTDFYKEGGFVAENALNIANPATSSTLTTGQYASVPSGAWLKGNFTISTWVYMRTRHSADRLFDFGTSGGLDNVLYDPSRNLISLYRGTAASTTWANKSLPLNQWTHVAITLSADTAKIYNNGILVGFSTGNQIPSGVITTNNFIGKDNCGSEYYFDGLVDEFQLYNVALSQDSIIARSHRPLTGNETGLQLYYNFNQITGSTVPNLAKATSNADATIYNGSTFAPSLAMKTPFARAETNFTCTSFTANWDKVPSATAYQLQYGTDKTFATPTTLNVTTNYATITGLVSNTKYYYRINSSAGTIVSNWAVDSIPFQTDKALDLASNSIAKLCSSTAGQYASVPAGVWFNGDFTVDSWVYLRSYLTWERLFDFSTATALIGGADNILFGLGDANASPYFGTYNGATQSGFFVNRKVELNKWTHIAVSMKGDTGYVYFNGELVGKGPLLKAQNVTRSYNYIGKSNWGSDNYANAQFDEFRIYNYALSQDSIKARSHRQLVGNEPGLQLYYNFNDLIGTTTVPNLATATVNGNATLYNTPSFTASKAATIPTTRAKANVTCTGFTATWDKVPSASYYVIQVGSDRAFSNIIGSAGGITTNSYAVTGLNANTKYYYRVNAMTCSGSSDWALDSISLQNKALDLANTTATLSSATTGQYASVPSGIWFNGDFTFDTWFYLRSNSHKWERIIDFGNGLASDDILFTVGNNSTNTNNDYPCIGIANGTNYNQYFITTPIPKNSWTHIAMTLSGTTLKVYYNGVIVSTFTVSYVPANINRSTNYIGKSTAGGDYYINAVIDEFRIYNYALSQDSIIARSHRQLTGNEPGLQLYYNFNDITGNTIPNLATLTNNAGNATIYNISSLPTATSTITPFIRAKTNISTTGFTANWDKIPNATNYQLSFSTDKTFGTGAFWYNPTANSLTLSNSLLPNTKYYYRVNATSCSTTSEWSPLDSISTPYLSVSSAHNALNLDGSTDYIKTSSLVTTAVDNITMEAWVKWNGPSSTGQSIISNGNNASSGYSIQVTSAGFLMVTCGNVTSMTTKTSLPTNVWQHVAVVRSSGTWSLYLNGSTITLIGSLGLTLAPNIPNGSTIIGGAQVNSTIGTENFNGTIDEVRIWNVARTQAEIQNNMYRGISSPKKATGLVAYYNFNQGTANGTNTITTAIDSSASANNATLTSFALSGTSSNFVNGAPFTTIGKAINNTTTATIASNTTWTASSNQPSWLTVSPTTGTGNGTLTLITTAANPSITTRSATITLSVSGNPAQTIVVTQVPCDTILTITPTTVSIGKAASSTATASVASNASWTASSIQDWLSVSPTITTTGAATLTFTTKDANPTISPRTATVKVSLIGATFKTIDVTQASGDTIFDISSPTATITSAISASATATVSTNAIWTASSDQSWLSVNPSTSTSGTGILTMTSVTANPLSTARIATVTVKISAGTKKTITVTQAAGSPTLSVSTTNNALNFDGSDDYVKTASLVTNATNSVTFEAWINWAGSNSKRQIIFLNGDAALSGYGIFIDGTNNNYLSGILCGKVYQWSTQTITPNTWNHVAYTCSTTGIWSLYLNGIAVPIELNYSSVNAPGTGTYTYIGSDNALTSNFNGSIDECKIWNVARTQAQIQTDMISTTPTSTSGLIFYSKFDQGVANGTNTAITTVIDSSASKNNGTIGKMTLTGNTSNFVNGAPVMNPNTTSTATLAKAANSSAIATIASNTTWTAVSNQTWLALSASSGSNNSAITLTANSENITIIPRTATVTISAANATTQTIVVTQEKGDTIFSVTPTTTTIAKAENSTATATVNTNATWTATTLQDWLTVTPNGSTSMTFIAQANPIIATRTATVTVSVSKTKSQTITITQAIGDTTLNVVSNSIHIEKDLNKTATDSVYSNATWNVTTDQPSWLSVSPTVGTGNGLLTLKTIEANPSISSRTAFVTVKLPSNTFKTFSVIQNPGDTTLIVTPATATIAKSAGSKGDIAVISNATWTANSTASWLSVSSSSATTGNGTVTYTVEENPTIATRTAIVTIKVLSNIFKTVTITQASGDATLSVSTNNVDIAKSDNSTATANVTSNADWTVSFVETWLKVDLISGNGDKTLVFTTTEVNPSTTPRIATVRVKVSANNYQDIVIKQSGSNASISVTPNTVSIEKDLNKTASADVKSNINWKATAVGFSWLSISPSVDTANNATLEFKVAEANPTISSRTAVVTVKSDSEGISQTISVVQAPGDTIFNVSPNEVSIASGIKSEATASVTSNATWIVSSNQSWLSVNPSSPTNGIGTITFTITEANPTINPRSATISIAVSANNIKTITVTQAPGEATLSASSLVASVTKAANNSTSVTITSNATWTASTDQPSWLDVTTDNATLNIKTKLANPTVKLRTAYVTVKVSDTKQIMITVYQAAGDTILSINQSDVSINKMGNDTANVIIKSNTSWTASTDQSSWLNVSPSSSLLGNEDLIITAKSANPTTDIRSAHVKIKVSNNISKVINVFQSAGDPTLLVTSSDISIDKGAKSTALTAVTSNTIWTASSDQTWLTVDPSSATFGNGTLTFTTTETNPSITKRTATIKVQSATIERIFTVTQAVGDTVFTVSSNTASVTKESASSASINVTSNASWDATCSDQSWLSISQSKGNGSTTLTFTTTGKNPTIVARTVYVNVQVSSIKKQIIAVTQAAGDATLIVSSNKETLTKTANSSAKVAVTSNTSWSASPDKDWLTVSPNSLTTGNDSLKLTATANPTIASRTATIVISATGVSPQSIVVTQDAGDPTLSVAKTSFNVSKEASSSTWVSISSNTSWTAKSSDQSWLTLSQESGFANGTLAFIVSGNTTSAPRTAKVTITAEGVTTSQTVTITQASCTITNSSISKTACDSIVYNDSIYKLSGDYIQTLKNKAGCDSIIHLSLIINHPTTSTIATSACNSYTYYGKTYTSSGTYTQKLVNKQGCDSIVTLNLTINKPTTSTVTEASCTSYTLNDLTYTKSGSYTQTIKNKAGCDSIITLQLTIKNPTQKTITATACGTYTLNGQNYTSTGKYYQTIPNMAGCDSTITLNVTINPVYNTSFKASACESYTYNQQTYTASGSYTHKFQSKLNCDSIVTLELTILGKPTISFTPSAPSTCKGVSTSIVANGAKTYSWSNGLTSATTTVTPTQTTSYTVTAVDANSCVNTASVSVTVNSLPTLTWNANNPILVCSDGSSTTISVDASTNGKGVFSGVSGLTEVDGKSTSFDPKQNNSGVKTINYDYIDINGCKASINGYIEVYTSPAPAIISKSVVSSTITGVTIEVPKDVYSGVKWYSQSGSPTLLASGDTLKLNVGNSSNEIPLNLAGDQLVVGSYKYNYSQTTKGCESKTSQAIIIVNNCPAQAPKADAVPKICFTGTTTTQLSATATDNNGNLTWFDGSDIGSAKTLASDVSKYTVTVTNVGSQVYYAAEYDSVHTCYSAPVAINVIAYSVPTIVVVAKENAVCKGSSTELQASGAATYAWTGTSGTSSSIVTPTTDTEYFVTGTDVNGCSNVASKNIKVKLPTTATITATACSSYTVNNVTYTKSDIYTQTLANNAGCDSIITLNVTITNPTTSTITTSTCKSYTLNGKTYDQSGTYTQTVQNKAKCDSIITLNLTITKPTVVSYSETAIGFYMFNMKKLTVSGTYTDTLVSKTNCDSIVTCNLTILQNKIPVSQIVAPNTLGIVAGETLLLSYTTLPSNATSKNIVFSSLDTTIATVDKTGLIKAKAKGVTYVNILETESLVSTLCLITVTDVVVPLEIFTLPPSLTMVIGETQTIPVKFTPSDASNQALSWSSPNTSKVTVDNFGVVHALATGKILLVATSISETDYISKSIVVNVLPSFKPVIKPLPAINIITGQTSKSFDISSYVSDDNTATKSLVYSFAGNNTTITPINDTVFSFAPKTIGAVYSDTITVSVTDKDKQTSSSKLVFNVMLAPNKAPKLSIIDTITIKSEKGHYEQNLVSFASDDYTLQSNLVWSLKNVAQHAKVAITKNVLMISSPVDGWSGKDSIIVKVTDGDGLSTDERIVIMVSSKPNQKPVVTQIPSQFNATSSPFKTIDLNQYVTDDYTQKSNIVWLTSESSKLSFAIENGIATISIKDPNWVGTTTISFTAMDEDFAMSSVNVFFAQTVPNSSTWMTKPNISFTTPNTTIGVGTPYELSATILGAESWKWKTEGGNPATSNDLNPIITYEKPGTYSVTLVAQNSKGIDSVVKTNLITVFGIVNNDTTVCKGTKVPVSVNLKDLTTYSWNTGDKTSSILTTITSDTVLIVTAQKDLKIFVDTIKIKVNEAVSLGKDTAICEGSAVTLNPGIFKSYKWQDGSTASTLALDNKTAKTYSVTVTDFGGCVSSDNVVVTEVKSVPVAGLSKTAIFCKGLTTTLTANTGLSYIWKDKFNTQTSTNNSLLVQNEGTYYVAVTGSNGCKSIDSTVVTVNPLPTVSLQASKATICLGDSVTFTTTGAKDYVWSNGISDGPEFKITTLGNNSYSVTGTDINGCINTAITSVTVNEVPELAINAKQYTICNGKKVTLDASGAPTLTWDNGVTNGQEFAPSVSGTYTATGTNSVGCIDTIHVNIVVNALPTVTAKADKNIVCTNTNVTLTGDGATSYTWDNNVIDNKAFAIAESKTFTVTGTDTKGCSSSANVAINVRNTFAEQIKVATYNEEGSGIIVAWTPTKGKGTSGYELQRLNDTTGTFKTVAIRGAQDSTYFVDKNADATLKAYSYKLITSDSVCSAKAESEIHKTIHLTPSQSTNESTEVVLEWNTYKGMTVTKYQIYVISKGKTIDTLYASDALNSEMLSQTYKEHKKGYKYRIAFDLPDSVFTGKLKSDSGPYSQSLSNMAESELVSSTILDGDFEVTLYPVPANSELHIKAELELSNYEIYDMLGQMVQRGQYSTEAININNLTNGLYEIVLHSDELTTKARFVKE